MPRRIPRPPSGSGDAASGSDTGSVVDGTDGTDTAAVREGGTVPGRPGAVPARRNRWLLWPSVAVVLIAALVAGAVVAVGTGGGNAPGGEVAPGIGAPAASMLGLDVLHGADAPRPPDFTLTDQHGRRVSLSDFRGKVVVLSFNDDRCPDLCTLLAQDVVVANRDLGAARRDVVFLSVNVNPFYPQVRYVRSWTDQHGLGAQRNWVFGTGPVTRLESIWQRYGITVQLTTTTRTVSHGTQLFFIDPTGAERAVGSFGTNVADTVLYSHDVARMAADLLPASDRGPVGGPSTPAPARTGAAVGAPAPSLSLPEIGRPGHRVSLSRLRGRLVVLEFWSSACAACERELPRVERAHRAFGPHVAFVGVDVPGHAGAARRVARRLGVTFPLVADARGTVAGAYRVPTRPFTVIVGRDGAVRVRHPGRLTTEQLEYVLQTFDPSLVRR